VRYVVTVCMRNDTARMCCYTFLSDIFRQYSTDRSIVKEGGDGILSLLDFWIPYIKLLICYRFFFDSQKFSGYIIIRVVLIVMRICDIILKMMCLPHSEDLVNISK